MLFFFAFLIANLIWMAFKEIAAFWVFKVNFQYMSKIVSII
jgi:hypothetical protein